jgi:hypothetical protein
MQFGKMPATFYEDRQGRLAPGGLDDVSAFAGTFLSFDAGDNLDSTARFFRQPFQGRLI